MGIYSTASLIWGIPVVAYTDDWEDDKRKSTVYWDDELEWWRSFEGELEVHSFGHYEDPDNHRGVLTSTRVEPLRGDCWEPKPVPTDLANEINNDKLYSKSNDQARANGLDVDFYSQAGWWLVTSVG